MKAKYRKIIIFYISISETALNNGNKRTDEILSKQFLYVIIDTWVILIFAVYL